MELINLGAGNYLALEPHSANLAFYHQSNDVIIWWCW